MHEDRRALFYLKKIPLLARLRAEVLAKFAEDVTVDEGRRRRVVFMPGDPGDAVFFVASGRVKLSRVTADGKELTLFYRTVGDLFGELCLIDGQPREEMAEVMEPAVFLRAHRERVERLIDEHPPLAVAFAFTLLEQQRQLERKMEDLVFKDVAAKLAELLLKLADTHGIEDLRGILIGMKITHQEMANLIGSTRETVSLTLSRLKRKKVITNQGRKLIITDRPALEALV